MSEKCRQRDGVLTVFVTVMGITLFLSNLFLEINILVTLAINILPSIVLAMFVYMYSRKNEEKTETVLRSMSTILREQASARKQRGNVLQKDFNEVCKNMSKNVLQMQLDIEKFDKGSSTDQYVTTQRSSRGKVYESIEKLKHLRVELSEFQTKKTMEDLRTILSIHDNTDVSENNFANDIKTFIQTLKALRSHVNNISIKRNMTLNENTDFGVSVDRTTYPLGSVIHVQVKIRDVVKGSKLFCQILNSAKEPIASGSYSESSISSELTTTNMFPIDFTMDGEEWEVGSEYFVQAQYGSESSEDLFSIDQKMPVLESDKSVYLLGSDIIITVIDPDANKDSNIIEYVGDMEGSMLTIESPHGKIEKYRLKETGKSTGVFQGILGILKVRKDGMIVPYEYDGKIIDKIQGTGIEDGFIGGSPGDKITIKYTSKTGTTKREVYISDFGPMIELDKNTYRPSDTVFITVIIPDLYPDCDERSKTKHKPEYTINVRTSMETIRDYRPAEIESDTEIFTGKIKLKNINLNVKSHTEPNDREIFCQDTDLIEVSLVIYDEEFTSKAEIKNSK